jgi:hypothetical protein
LLLQSLVERGAVGQAGERVVMGQVFDTLFRSPPLGDIFVRSNPRAVRQRLAHHRDDAAVGAFNQGTCDLSGRQRFENPQTVFIGIAIDRSPGLAVANDILKLRARLHDIGGQAVHFDVTIVANDKPLRGVEHDHAL